MTAEPSRPKPGTRIQFRCQWCGSQEEGVQPKPGRWLVVCRPCARAITKAVADELQQATSGPPASSIN